MKLQETVWFKGDGCWFKVLRWNGSEDPNTLTWAELMKAARQPELEGYTITMEFVGYVPTT